MAKLFMLIATNGKNKSQEIKGAIMKEYKRLTKYSEINKDYITPYCDTKKCNGVCRDCDYEQIIINRLAELENKIENGTLVELPCKVGDKIWYISMLWRDGKFAGEIYDANVDGFYISDGLIQIEDDIIYHYHNYGEEVFLTREEAEAKLKELQNERN